MLPPVKRQMGAYPSMWDTVFPARGSKPSPELYKKILDKSRSEPAEVTQQPVLTLRTPLKTTKTPFDWGKVAANYQVPEWARKKRAKPYLSRANTPRRPSCLNTSAPPGKLTDITHGQTNTGTDKTVATVDSSPEAQYFEENDGDCPENYLTGTLKEVKNVGCPLNDGGNWKNDDTPNVFVYNKGKKRDRYITDAIHQTETAGEYLQERRLREGYQAAMSVAKHRSRARQIEDEVRRYFLPPLVQTAPQAKQELEDGEEPGRLSRMNTEIVSSNTGWRTKIIRRFHKQHPDPGLPNTMPKFSYMAGLMAKNK